MSDQATTDGSAEAARQRTEEAVWMQRMLGSGVERNKEMARVCRENMLAGHLMKKMQNMGFTPAEFAVVLALLMVRENDRVWKLYLEEMARRVTGAKTIVWDENLKSPVEDVAVGCAGSYSDLGRGIAKPQAGSEEASTDGAGLKDKNE